MSGHQKSILIVLIACLIAAILWTGDRFLVTREGTFLKSDIDALHEEANADETTSVIDFPLLDEARPMDLIDMTIDFPVELVGFMAPFDSLDDMRRCMIVPSYVGCSFCAPPSLTQVVFVDQERSGEETNRRFPFIEEPARVTGVLRLDLPGSTHLGREQGFLFSLENAVVTPHTEASIARAPGHDASPANGTAHQAGQIPLEPVSIDDLISEVAELRELAPQRPIALETVSRKVFSALIRDELAVAFPSETLDARTAAFALLDTIPAEADWMEQLTALHLSRKIAMTDESGERIHLLENLPTEDPYVRLALVGEITDALNRQHFPPQKSNATTDDERRAAEALRQGLRVVTIYRYARIHGISPAVPPPVDLALLYPNFPVISIELDLWYSLPGEVGPFFVDFCVGATGPLAAIDSVFSRPPRSTLEFFRPLWYEDPTLWRRNPVPENFADSVLDSPPAFTDVFGVGGIVPWLSKAYPVDVAKSLAGDWAGDRFAVWLFPDGEAALLLETRWQDADAALRFHEAVPDHPFQRLESPSPGSSIVRLIRATGVRSLERIPSVPKEPR